MSEIAASEGGSSPSSLRSTGKTGDGGQGRGGRSGGAPKDKPTPATVIAKEFARISACGSHAPKRAPKLPPAAGATPNWRLLGPGFGTAKDVAASDGFTLSCGSWEQWCTNVQTLFLLIICVVFCSITTRLSQLFNSHTDGCFGRDELAIPSWLRSALVANFAGQIVFVQMFGARRFSELWLFLMYTPMAAAVPHYLFGRTEAFVDFRRVQDEPAKRAVNLLLFFLGGCTHAANPRSLAWKLRHGVCWICTELLCNATLSTTHGLGASLLQYDVFYVICPWLAGALITQLILKLACTMLGTELPIVSLGS